MYWIPENIITVGRSLYINLIAVTFRPTAGDGSTSYEAIFLKKVSNLQCNQCCNCRCGDELSVINTPQQQHT